VVGDDVVVLERPGDTVTLLALRAVASVRPSPGAGAITGDRRGHIDTTLAELLRLLVSDRPRIAVAAGDHLVTGELVRVGVDVVTVRLEGDAGQTVLAVGAVDEVVVDDPGVLTRRN
jgi:hypothetical protein